MRKVRPVYAWLAYAVLVALTLLAVSMLASLVMGSPAGRLVQTPPAFPFRTVIDSLEGWEVKVHSTGNCDTTTFTLLTVNRPDGGEGWYLYYGNNNRIVGVHYAGVLAQTPADWIVFTVVERQVIRIVREEPFNSTKHEGPCQWFDEVRA